MRDSGEIARESLVSVQRTFLFFTPGFKSIEQAINQDGKKSWVFVFGFENAGNTPAHKVLLRLNKRIDRHPLPLTFTYQDLPLEGQTFTNMIGRISPVGIGHHQEFAA